MLKIIIFGLVLVAIALSGIMSVTSAETVPSPLQQVRDGVPTDEVMCSEDRVLMESQSGMPACVFVDSVFVLDKRGFVLLGEITSKAFPIRAAYNSGDLSSPASYIKHIQTTKPRRDCTCGDTIYKLV